MFQLRESSTALGLVRKAKGVLSVTKLCRKLADDPAGLVAHLRSRLPLGRDFEQDAGLLALLFAAAGKDWWHDRDEATTLYADLGWHDPEGRLEAVLAYAAGPTATVLEHAAGRQVTSAHRAAIARLVLRR